MKKRSVVITYLLFIALIYAFSCCAMEQNEKNTKQETAKVQNESDTTALLKRQVRAQEIQALAAIAQLFGDASYNSSRTKLKHGIEEVLLPQIERLKKNIMESDSQH